ncbi:uncharacterized protein FIBRA_08966 [Fibroporia radiculosa]|uniref:Uncharacterized protein n=1 Tax=Fibroporia radiculosa TaxID=599839 RepID=J4ICM7_9APHY|nr:uncharacterized protein FIBRA_08966 [Fibroporia radiculosa]CCM06681.1 predicted protein [Fibroporia radiculosa]
MAAHEIQQRRADCSCNAAYASAPVFAASGPGAEQQDSGWLRVLRVLVVDAVHRGAADVHRP